MARRTEQDMRPEQPETFLPEPGELFVEETPKPFADSLREVLEEYRSDNSPSRYAMAVELGEADDWELYQGPQPKPEPFYPVNSAAMQSLLHDSWSGADTPRAREDWDWAEIVREFRGGDAQDSAEIAVQREQPPMTKLQEQSNSPLPAESEPALPAGFHTLTERRVAPLRPEITHLSVEDILAEYRGFGPSEEAPAEEPGPEAETPAPEPEAAAEETAEPPKSRLAGLEAEARSLLSAFRRGRRPSEEAPEEEAPPAEEEPPAPGEAPAEEEPPAPPAEPEPEPAGEADSTKPEAAWDGEAPEKPPLFAALRTKLGRRRKGKQAPPKDAAGEQAAGFRDEDAAPAVYAEDGEYEREEEPPESFPSFGEYLAGLAIGVWVRLRGVGGRGGAVSASASEIEEEPLGEEVRPAQASRYYGSFVPALRLRFRLALSLWLVMAYLTLGLPASGMLRTIDVAAGMLLALQLGILLLSLDVVTGAVLNVARGRFGADALAVLCCLLTSLDALSVMFSLFGKPHVPLCLFSSFSLLGVLFASRLSARGLRKALRVPAIGKNIHSVTAESGLKDASVTLVKSPRPPQGFVRRSEEAAPDELAYYRAAPLLLLLSLLMTVVLVLVKRSPEHFLFVFTALLAPAVPVTALLCFALPFLIGSERIFPSGAAIAGWSGLCDIGGSHNLIVTDRDLFPDDTVQIDSIRIFADEPSEKVISYAGTMIAASGCGMGPCFAELMERNACPMRQLERFEVLPGGGMRGTIDGHTVLCGGLELMRLMNVSIPYRLVSRTSVLLAIDGTLYGIFNMKYEPDKRVRKALVGLMRSNRHAVFAVRDFNINPAMLHETFDLATDGYDFPPYLERFHLSEAQSDEQRRVAAVLCREGLGPLVHMADTGRSMFLTVRLNLFISLLASLLGVFAVFFQLFTGGSITVAALFLYAVFWIFPVALISLFVRF